MSDDTILGTKHLTAEAEMRNLRRAVEKLSLDLESLNAIMSGRLASLIERVEHLESKHDAGLNVDGALEEVVIGLTDRLQVVEAQVDGGPNTEEKRTLRRIEQKIERIIHMFEQPS
jgi:hypothetical protein